MSRYVVRKKYLKSGGGKYSGGYLASGTGDGALSESTYQDRLLKYIPAEIIGLHVTVTAVMKGARSEIGGSYAYWSWGLFAFLTLLTYLFVKFSEEHNDVAQHIAIVAAFIVWVFALGGPFETTSWYSFYMGALVLPVYSTILAKVLK